MSPTISDFPVRTTFSIEGHTYEYLDAPISVETDSEMNEGSPSERSF
jgi:hypothetical protein